MADILSSQTTVPSLYTQTESAVNLVGDSSKKISSSQPTHSNKYNGHVRRLRNIFADQSLTSEKASMNSSSSSSPRMMMINPLINDDFSSHHRRYSSQSEPHYDFPADAVEQLKKHQHQQRDDQDGQVIIPSLLPANIFKRMNHLNTTFVKPTKIEGTLPKLIFEEPKKKKTTTTMKKKKDYQRTESLESPAMTGKD